MRNVLALSLIVLLGSARATRAQTLYWTQMDRISKVESDGTGNGPLLAGDAAGLPTDIELDRAAGRLYWTDTFGPFADSIRSAGTDGRGPTVVLDSAGSPQGLALLPDVNTMLWASRASNQIEASNLDGTGRGVLVPNVIDPRGLEVDPIGRKVYWVEFGGKLRRADLDGSHVTDVVTTGMSRPFDVDVDPINGKLYWAELGPRDDNRGSGSIFRLNLDGTGVERILTGLSQPSGIDVDPLGGRLYFVNGLEGDILYSNLDGTGLTTVAANVGLPQFLVVDSPQVPEPGSLPLVLAAAVLLRRRARR